jgi:hypothetical protein
MHNAVIPLMLNGAEKFPHQCAVLRETELKIIHGCVALKNILGMIGVL